MGWSNTATSAIVVGGNGTVGSITILDANGNLLATIDQHFITLYANNGNVIGQWNLSGLTVTANDGSGNSASLGTDASLDFSSTTITQLTGNARISLQVYNNGTNSEQGSLFLSSPEIAGRVNGYLDIQSASLDGVTVPQRIIAYGTIIPSTAQTETVETWHNLTLQNGFTGVVQGGWYQGIRYRLDACGNVEIDGAILPPTTPANLVVGTLPAGYRPSSDKLFLCLWIAGTGKIGDFLINSSGQMQWLADFGNPAGTGNAYITAHWSAL